MPAPDKKKSTVNAAGNAKGKQFVAQPKSIALKTSKFR
jgi:hypothetical protein